MTVYSVMAVFATVFANAQIESVNTKVKKTSEVMDGEWINNPLIWVIAALVLIIIIALIAKNGGNTDKI